MNKPIKRHDALQPWSRDHHHGLLLSWKIKKGFSLGVDPLRIKNYTDWFWNTQLKEHFKTEEKFIFPILGNDHPLVEQALDEHRRIEAFFYHPDADTEVLSEIESHLNDHIRFEERVLFNAIQEVATRAELELLGSVHSENENCEVWEDEFRI
jgi:iron-sulfur cluster repair protein YtfE (RIC family)